VIERRDYQHVPTPQPETAATPVVVRFAPSPTGRLHVGNVRTALFNWLFARRLGGSFVLRLDDTDRARSTEAFAEGIYADLRWLGLDWQRLERQSLRTTRYDEVRDALIAAGRLYPCYETPEELEFRRKRLLAQGKPPVYDRAALRLGPEDRARLEAEGRRPHWRFRLDPGDVTWPDLVRGPQHIDESSQSDPVLVRADGSYLYTLPSVVDDIDFGITHVIRGEDHVTNTGTQIQIFRALGATVPQFAHLPLLLDERGAGLSKRLDSLAIADLRAQGLEPLTVSALLARLGTADPVEPIASLASLIERVDFGHVGRAPARFSESELWALNARVLHGLPFDAVRDRLAAIDPRVDAPLWDAVHANLERMGDIAGWVAVVHGPLAPAIDDADGEFLAAALAALPAEPWDATTWSAWTRNIAAASGRKGRALFLPLRRALTAQEHGPEMARLLPLIGRARVAGRLEGNAT
jgi:glutamyl-tRNA synthetase